MIAIWTGLLLAVVPQLIEGFLSSAISLVKSCQVKGRSDEAERGLEHCRQSSGNDPDLESGRNHRHRWDSAELVFKVVLDGRSGLTVKCSISDPANRRPSALDPWTPPKDGPSGDCWSGVEPLDGFAVFRAFEFSHRRFGGC